MEMELIKYIRSGTRAKQKYGFFVMMYGLRLLSSISRIRDMQRRVRFQKSLEMCNRVYIVLLLCESTTKSSRVFMDRHMNSHMS